MIDTLPQFLAYLEKGNAALANLHRLTGLGIAPDPWFANADLEAPETPYLDSIAAHQGLGHAVEDCIYDDFDIPRSQI
jgi:hypothetical protein